MDNKSLNHAKNRSVWIVVGHDLGGNGGTAIDSVYSSEVTAKAREAALKAIYVTPGGKYASDWSSVWTEERTIDHPEEDVMNWSSEV